MSGPASVKMYDFKRPDKFSRDQIRTLQMLHTTFARLMTGALSNRLGSRVETQVRSVDQMTFEEFRRSIPDPTAIYLLGMDGLAGTAILEIDPTVVFAMLDRLYGGSGVPLAENRELTPLEKDVLSGVAADLTHGLREAWSVVADVRPRVLDLETRVAFAEIVPPNDMVVLVTLETVLGEAKGMMNLCFPFICLETILERLSPRWFYGVVSARGPKPTVPLADLGSLPFSAEVSWPIGEMPCRVLQGLAPGQVLPLHGVDPGSVQVSLGGGAPRSVPVHLGETLTLGPLPPLATERKIRKNPLSSPPPPQTVAEPAPETLAVPAMSGEAIESFFAGLDPDRLLSQIQNEHPQAVALILSHLGETVASRLLAQLPPEMTVPVTTGMARLGRVDTGLVAGIVRFLRDRQSVGPAAGTTRGGLTAAAKILSHAPRDIEKRVLETLEVEDPDLAESIKENMFVFEDLILLADRELQVLLREVEHQDLVKALHGSSEALRGKIFRNVSPRAAKAIQEDMDGAGPVSLPEVDICQSHVLRLIRRLEDEGRMTIARPGDAMVLGRNTAKGAT